MLQLLLLLFLPISDLISGDDGDCLTHRLSRLACVCMRGVGVRVCVCVCVGVSEREALLLLPQGKAKAVL